LDSQFCMEPQAMEVVSSLHDNLSPPLALIELTENVTLTSPLRSTTSNTPVSVVTPQMQNG
jgi:hypothetical protein